MEADFLSFYDDDQSTALYYLLMPMDWFLLLLDEKWLYPLVLIIELREGLN
ncbi:MAG: hypothetical protein K9L22_01330 [Methylococcaceae bacterium]|nr:hypothetical protein [Methylococcaceae bacterium]